MDIASFDNVHDYNTESIRVTDNLRIGSFNVNGLKSSLQAVRDLCEKCDIVFLQETLLLPFDCYLVNQVHEEFFGIGLSNTSIELGPLRGRPVGGLAVLWRRSLNNIFRFYPLNDCQSAICMKLSLPGSPVPWYLLGIYLPTDYGTLDSLTTYSEALAALECCVNSLDSPNFFCIGDFNAAFSPVQGSCSRFMQELLNVCEENNWVLLDRELLPGDSFTFVSPAHFSTSWIDHFLISPSMSSNSYDCEVLYDISPIDHMPMVVSVTLPVSLQEVQVLSGGQRGYHADWKRATTVERKFFTVEVEREVAKVDWDSYTDTDTVYQKLVDILVMAEEHSIPERSGERKGFGIPGWNERVRELYACSRNAFFEWKQSGRPQCGPLHSQMCSTRKTFKKAFKQCKAEVSNLQRERFGNYLCSGDKRGFWKAVQRLSPRAQVPNSVEGISGSCEVAQYWGTFFRARFSSSGQPLSSDILDDGVDYNIEPNYYTCESEVKKIILSLDLGKASGPDGLSAHLLRNCPDSVFLLFADIFNYSLHTGSLPRLLKLGTLIPIVKNRQGDLSSAANYRGICISSLLSKVFEKIILRCISPWLTTSPAQFGFKPSHDTNLATFTVENIIEHYNRAGSPVYAAFLDASQAFDNVSHNMLFKLLCNRGVPNCFLRVLGNWYSSGELQVAWDGQVSSSFYPGKGVRQGSCLSPHLFNVYIDYVINKVRNLSVGCHISGVASNIIAYADDLILLAPSFSGLQTLLNVCGYEAEQLNIRFNAAKSGFVYFKAFKAAQSEHPTRKPSVQGNVIPIYDKFVHLGHNILADLSQASEIARARRAFFRMLNLILSRFYPCTPQVKVELFRAFCLHLYGCELWTRLTRTQKRELEVSLHTAIKRLGGYTRFSRNSISCMDMGMLTMDRQIAFRQLCFFKRVLDSPNIIVQAVIGHEDAFGLSFFQHVHEICDSFGLINVCMRDVSSGDLKHFMWCHMEKYIFSLDMLPLD